MRQVLFAVQATAVLRRRITCSHWIAAAARFIAVLFPLVVAGCTTVGTGDRTVIRATTKDQILAKEFPFLLTTSERGSERTLVIDRSTLSVFPLTATTSRDAQFNRFKTYMEAKYGDRQFEGALLTVEVRDLGRSPAFATDVNTFLRQEIVKVLNDKELKPEEREARVQELRAVVRNEPAAAYSTTLNRITEDGEEIFYYYPRLQIDFTADLLSSSTLDRFTQLIMYLELSEDVYSKNVRFLDFSPKPSDIVDYSRGQLKQAAELQAKVSAGRTTGSGKTTVSGDTTKTSESALNLGADIAFTATEEYTRQLQDALERRTAGIVNDGRALLVQFRAVRQFRIGGTYTFDVMLEIPSEVTKLSDTDEQYYALNPVVNIIQAKVALIGVVRHVYDRGRTGFFNIVPEIENDDVYEQVVLELTSDKELWSFNGESWVRPYVFEAPSTFTVHVVTNHELGNFVVTDITNPKEPKILGRGKGEENKVKVKSYKFANRVLAKIDFYPIVHFADKGAVAVVKPSLSTSQFYINAKDTGTRSFTVKYE